MALLRSEAGPLPYQTSTPTAPSHACARSVLYQYGFNGRGGQKAKKFARRMPGGSTRDQSSSVQECDGRVAATKKLVRRMRREPIVHRLRQHPIAGRTLLLR
jgi:hypothetical protein